MKHISRRSLLFLILLLACLSCMPLPTHAKLELSKEIDKQMSDCLDEVEYKKYLKLLDEYRGMRNPGSVKISDKYKLTDVVKDDKGKAICDLPGLPTWATALCTARTIVDSCEKARKTKLRGRMGRMYAYYIRDHRTYYDQGNDPVPAQPLPEEIRHDPGMKYEHDKLKQIEDMFKKGVVAYYIKMRDLERDILVYRDKCIEVPNLVGLTYDTSLERTGKKGFSASMIQQPRFRDLKNYNKKAPLIIYKQDPAPGSLRPKAFSIKIWVRNELKNLKADPPSWHGAKVGDAKSFVVTAELLNGKKIVTKDQDCKWHTTDTNVVKVLPTKGEAKAAGPGKAEVRVLYDHHDGVKLASHVVRIPVTVLAPVKPPPKKDTRKLLSFKLKPQGPVDITIGGPPRQLTGVATFSDRPGQKFNVTKHCKPWTSDGKPDLTVKKGLVKAHSAKLHEKKHVIHTTYTYEGQTMKYSVQFRIVGTGTGQGGIPPTDTYTKLTLNPSDITMEPRSVESIRATALYSKAHQVIPKKDVTFDSNIAWSSSNPSVAEFVNGVITSKTSVGFCVITAIFTPPGAKKPLTAQCKVTVKMKPIVMDFEVSPKPGPYSPGDILLFTEDIKVHDKSQYDLTWYVEKREVTGRDKIKHTFKKPGKYQVRLVARHRKTGVDDAIAKSITIEQPSDVEVKIGFSPETNVYKIGSTIGFTAKTKNAKKITEYRWYVSGEYIGSGKTGVSHKFEEDGEYEIKLGLRMGSNFDEQKVTRTLSVGKAGIGVLGTWRNRFKAVGGPDDLEIQSQYWVGGAGKWSELISFNSGHIGEVDHYIFYTGKQQDGWNTGFLVYVPRGGDKIMFKVFHFRWPKNPKIGPSARGIVHYEGQLPLHNKTPIPESIKFTRQASRLCIVEWRTRDGSSCRARIGKFKKTNQDAMSGVKDLGCEKGVYPPIEDKIDTPDPDTTDDVVEDRLADRLVSGSYRVDVWVTRHFPSTWKLKVSNGRISGMSKWGCCPGPRNDPLKGRIDGDKVVITRDCTGQGYSGPCSQDYTGKLNGNVIEGSFTLNERKNFGTWTLYLESKDDPSLTDDDDDTGGSGAAGGGEPGDDEDDISGDDLDDIEALDDKDDDDSGGRDDIDDPDDIGGGAGGIGDGDSDDVGDGSDDIEDGGLTDGGGLEDGLGGDRAKTDDDKGWTTKGSGSGQSICPKAAQWESTGGFKCFSVRWSWNAYFYRYTWGKKDPFFTQGDDPRIDPPRHSHEKVLGQAVVKVGKLTVQGPGCVVQFGRVLGPGPWVRLYDVKTGQRFNPQSGGGHTMYRTKAWKWINKRWEGEWSGKWTGDVNGLAGLTNSGGYVPEGQIREFVIKVDQGWYENMNVQFGSMGFSAPCSIEYELWFFPREGGGVKVERYPVRPEFPLKATTGGTLTTPAQGIKPVISGYGKKKK